MSFINWSDPEEMLGLLAEYVDDERLTEQDRQRTKFLDELSSELIAIASLVEESTRETIDRLCSIYDSQPAEFRTDPALIHLGDCIQELERIVAEAETTPN